MNKAWSSSYVKEGVTRHSILIYWLWGSSLIHPNKSQTQVRYTARAGSATHPPLSCWICGGNLLPKCRNSVCWDADTYFKMRQVVFITPSRLALHSLAQGPRNGVWIQKAAIAIKGCLRWSLPLLVGGGWELFQNEPPALDALHPTCRITSWRV